MFKCESHYREFRNQKLGCRFSGMGITSDETNSLSSSGNLKSYSMGIPYTRVKRNSDKTSLKMRVLTV